MYKQARKSMISMLLSVFLVFGMIIVPVTAMSTSAAEYPYDDEAEYTADAAEYTADKVTFGVICDMHIGATGHGAGATGQADRLNKILEWYNEQDVAALAMVGDITANGNQANMTTLKNCIDNYLDPSIKVLASMGNHEYDTTSNSDIFSNTLGMEPNAHYVIEGYHFITLSPGFSSAGVITNPRNDAIAARGRNTTLLGMGNDTYSHIQSWAEQRIQYAIAEDPDKPVFVFFHHPLRYSFYVSDEWYGSGLGNGNSTFLSRYPQVVSFSAHIHSPNNEPRSIWQDGGFTAVNVVTTYYFELERGFVGNNRDATGTSTMAKGDGIAEQGLVIEVEDSVVTIKNYDFASGEWIDQTWTFDVNEELPYTIAKRAAKAQKPAFAEDAEISVSNVQVNEITVTFDVASLPNISEVGEIIHHYRYTLRNAETGALVRTFNQWSDFMFLPVRDTYTQIIGGLTHSTEYSLTIEAVGSFGLVGGNNLRSEPISTVFATSVTVAGLNTAITQLEARIEAMKSNEDVSDYTEESWGSMIDAIDAAKEISAQGAPTQDDLDNAFAKLKTTERALALKNADYSELESAIAAARTLNSTLYTNYDKVEEAIAAVVYGLSIREQDTVDGFVAAIDQAVAELDLIDFSTTVIASVGAAPETHFHNAVEYTLALREAVNVLAVDVEFVIDGAKLAASSFETLNGFTVLEQIKWIDNGDGTWTGAVKFGYAPPVGEYGFTAEPYTDIAKFIFDAKGLGEAELEITRLMVTGFEEATDEVVFYNVIIETGIGTTLIGNRYDLNKDGVIDLIDLGIMLLYVGFNENDPEWDTLVKVFDKNGLAITAKDCDVNGDGEVDMADIVELIANF